MHWLIQKNFKRKVKKNNVTNYFNFNNIYGQELASNFIEVHHIKPLSQHEGTVNPETDLVPVCPNCHRMLHRYRNKTLTIDELKNILENNKNK